MKIKRRNFNMLVVASVGGILAGAQQKVPLLRGAYAEGAEHVCAGKNDCKGQGGCATVAKHDCASKNDCKGQGGCKSGDNGCAGKNSCKGHGGCKVPLDPSHMEG